MDSFRYEGNVIHIIGGDDKPVSVTGNEYDTAYDGTASDFNHDGNVFEENIDRTLKHCKKFYSEEGCPFGDDCTFVHDLDSKYRERTAIHLSGGRFGYTYRDRRDTSVLSPVAPPTVLAALPQAPQSAVATSPSAPQLLPAAEADATVKPLNWRTRMCMKWEYSGHCKYGSKCLFAHSETELRRYGGALVNPQKESLNVPNSVAAPGSSCAVVGGAGQLQGAQKRSGQTTWKFPKKTNGIYGDWIDDIQ